MALALPRYANSMSEINIAALRREENKNVERKGAEAL